MAFRHCYSFKPDAEMVANSFEHLLKDNLPPSKLFFRKDDSIWLARR